MKVFKEEQRFTKTWVIVILILTTLVPLFVFVKEFLNDKFEFTFIKILPFLLIIFLPFVIIFGFKLKTKIDEIGIHYQFKPFHFSSRIIKWNNISKVYVRTYSPIAEYGGWGYRSVSLFRKNKGKALNVSGDIGIQIEYDNGKKLLIGTQKEANAKKVLQTYQTKIN